MKHVFLMLSIRNGEYEYTSKTVHSIPTDKNVSEFSEEYASSFYGGEPDPSDDGYYFNAGEVHVSVCKVEEINDKHFNVLKQFI